MLWVIITIITTIRITINQNKQNKSNIIKQRTRTIKSHYKTYHPHYNCINH